jgi:hypothetical protein
MRQPSPFQKSRTDSTGLPAVHAVQARRLRKVMVGCPESDNARRPLFAGRWTPDGSSQGEAAWRRGPFWTQTRVRFRSSTTEGYVGFGFALCSRHASRCAGGITRCASTVSMGRWFRIDASCPSRCTASGAANPAKRLRLLIEHYRLSCDLTTPDCLRAICAGEVVELTLMPGRNGTRFRLFLVSSSVVRTQREGVLIHEPGHTVAARGGRRARRRSTGWVRERRTG